MAFVPLPSLAQVQAGIKDGSLDGVSLVQQCLERIHQENPKINAFIDVFDQEALERAALVQEKIRSGGGGKLAGLIIGIKDLIAYKGHGQSGSSRILEPFKAIFNSTVVERLLAEDAIIIGRQNCDEFAMGASNETSYYGPVRNPLDLDKVPGGSSGGSAAAVAAGMCMASLGTDTGGSVRQPASFCGLWGIKPTYGRVSRHGIIAYASSFDQVSPISQHAEDLGLILDVIAGPDEWDSTCIQTPPEPFSTLPPIEPGKKFKFAVLQEALDMKGLDPEIKKRTEEFLDSLKAAGHEVQEAHFPYLDVVVPTYYVLTTAEASSNLSRYDGVHYGYRSPEAHTLEETYVNSRSEGFGTEVKRRIMLGTFVLSAGYYDAYYTHAQKVRRLIRERSLQMLEKADFVLLPTTPTTAFGLGEKSKDPVSMYLADIFTVQAPLAGLPAISIPMFQHSNGLPFGLQLMGKDLSDARMIRMGQWFYHNFAS